MITCLVSIGIIIFGFNFDANSIWDQFKSLLLLVIDMYVPVKYVLHNSKHNIRRYSNHIRKLLTRKRAIWRALKSKKTPELRTRYNHVSNQCRLEIINFDVSREQKILNANNLGSFYRYVNKRLSSTTGIAPLKDHSGEILFSDVEKAELLNEYFVSVFTVDDGNIPPFTSRLPSSSSGINDINTSPAAVRRVLGSLKS